MNAADAEAFPHSDALTRGKLSVVEDGFGPPVLLGHGYLWDAEMWAPQVQALRPHCRLVIPEMWGHGQSGALPPGTHSLADLADQMLRLLDHLEIERCVVVGASIGGMWAAHLAARAPARVAGLVIMNSFVGEEPPATRTAFGTMLDRVEATGHVSPRLTADIAPLFLGAGVEERAPQLSAALQRKIDSFGAAALRKSIVPLGRMIFERPDDLGILSQIRAPTLVLTGAQDRARTPEESRIMARLLGAELIVLPNCGHAASLEQPEAVNAVLLGFLEKLNWLA